jgi:D-glycero-alpha-D-manno-heptose-7-phosphate kinase
MSQHVLTSVITATPFRVSLFGGGTDFPGYFNRRGGLVLASAIRKYSYVALNSLERLMEQRFRISYSQLEMVDSVEHIRHNIIRTALTEHNTLIDDCFVDIHSYADLPSGTGIGSSSAFSVGLLNALHALNGIYMPPKALAKRAIHLERDLLGDVGGWQDQVMSAHGGFNIVRFHDDDFEVEPLIVSLEQRRVIEESCWLYFTSIQRSSAAVQQMSFSPANIVDKEKVLDQTRELAEEAVRAFYAEPDPRAVMRRWGDLLDLSWSLKRSLSGAVSSSEIDLIYESARAAGAYGGKIIGAGGGGFLLVMGPPERQAAIDAAVGNLRRFHLRLDPNGSRVVYANDSP